MHLTRPPNMSSFSSIPSDVSIRVASFLEATDVCCLSSCSKYWYELCSSDSLWVDLINKRWPNLGLAGNSSSPFQGWKSLYISKHTNFVRGVSIVIQYVEKCGNHGSLEVGYYLKAMKDLSSMELGFKDVQMILLARKHSVLLNLIGLHYCLCFLGASPNDVVEALNACQVADRVVRVSWLKLGRWFAGFRLNDEQRSLTVSLQDLAMAQGNGQEVLSILNRGAVHEVLRVQIIWNKSLK